MNKIPLSNKKNGVKVVSAKENISDEPEGIILKSMLEGYAEYYSAKLSVKIKRGQKENAMKRKINGSSAPIGYYVDKSTCKLAIDQTSAPVIREIFERYTNGQRMTEIADWLNGTGLKTSQGNEFKNSNIGKILRNRKYNTGGHFHQLHKGAAGTTRKTARRPGARNIAGTAPEAKVYKGADCELDQPFQVWKH